MGSVQMGSERKSPVLRRLQSFALVLGQRGTKLKKNKEKLRTIKKNKKVKRKEGSIPSRKSKWGLSKWRLKVLVHNCLHVSSFCNEWGLKVLIHNCLHLSSFCDESSLCIVAQKATDVNKCPQSPDLPLPYGVAPSETMVSIPSEHRKP